MTARAAVAPVTIIGGVKGQLIKRGLRRYARHPNHFGDACMRRGLFGLSYGPVIAQVTV